MEWIKLGDELPRGDYLVCTKSRQVMQMKYTWNPHAKTQRGRMSRWEWNGRISPWEITHYMNLPTPPAE